MIRTILADCAWGIDPIEQGIQINLQDRHSGQIFHIPFQGDSLAMLVRFAAERGLTDEQKRELAPLFQSGIILPGPSDYQRGPQG